ncbi:hypothetical protein PPL_07217 [Heterostelium album PN500]|uniref:Uroporphyrinogen-III synthase n=1 Tax=Heterostelium pallidum (strain ATCC 26659 / Pp 5 / PN500) TaxID=670386 RepID=D3BEQ2_HETP5|nr:hypothetical protein PPL_07217 [Heterostelium album PN500]EFA80383.1 hypothetical protein PPL_07217 [Heterostelium album PN500]|eukprot:XP_020432503.1 hypothetical protein PPL_07217 [Heterostelium album PN500]
MNNNSSKSNDPKLNNDDPYQVLFRENGYNVEFQTVLNIKRCGHQSLIDTLFEVDNYDCLLVTSINAIHTLVESIDFFNNTSNNNKTSASLYINILKQWVEHKQFLFVGESSLNHLNESLQKLNLPIISNYLVATNARSLGSSIIIDQQQKQEQQQDRQEREQQNGIEKAVEKLGEYDHSSTSSPQVKEDLQKSTTTSLKILYLCGNLRRDELPSMLVEPAFKLKELVVYETTSIIINDMNDVDLDQQQQHPSGVSHSTVKLGHRIAAIGKTTAQAIESHGIRVDAVALQPTPNSLLESIENNNNNNNNKDDQSLSSDNILSLKSGDKQSFKQHNSIKQQLFNLNSKTKHSKFNLS